MSRKLLYSILSWNSNLHLLKAYLMPDTLPTSSEQICQIDFIFLFSQMRKVRLREVNFFVKVTQLRGDRIPFKPRQSDARACSGNRSSTQCYWKGAERERP